MHSATRDNRTRQQLQPQQRSTEITALAVACTTQQHLVKCQKQQQDQHLGGLTSSSS
jgi:hypothetical protein